MREGQAPKPPADETQECLHCAIMDMVEERIAAGDADAASLTTLITEALVDVVLLVPEEEKAKLMAHILSVLGDLFLQKSDEENGGSRATH